MNGVGNPPPGVDPAALGPLLALAHRELVVAILLSAGILCAFALIVLAAMGCRRSALAFGLLYSATLCGVPVGYARVLGPCGISVALVGILRPGVGGKDGWRGKRGP